MNQTKILIPNKEWLITKKDQKIGGLSKERKGYRFFQKGKSVSFKNLSELKEKLGIAFFDESIKNLKTDVPNSYSIYDFPCNSKPHEPIYNLKKRLPLFAKNAKSKSQYCAGHYVIKFRKGWVKSFCPKLITLERYPYYGPFKTEEELKIQLAKITKYEET